MIKSAHLHYPPRTYLATAPSDDSILNTLYLGPVFELIASIQLTEPATSRALLRRPILLNYEPGLFERSLIRVQAKRWARGHPSPLESPSIRMQISIRDLIAGLLPPEPLGPEIPRYARDRPITALIHIPGAHPIRAVNRGSRLRLAHAELMAILQTQQTLGIPKFPPGSRLYSSLKPCRACAALWLESLEDPSQPSVFYQSDDPGPHARNTCLNFGSYDQGTAIHLKILTRHQDLEKQLTEAEFFS